MYGGDNGAGNQYLIGGYGSDTIIAGNGVQGAYVIAYGDQKEATLAPYVLPDGSTWSKYRGAPDDGDDIIQMGDHPDIGSDVVAYGNGGNDKIFGGIG